MDYKGQIGKMIKTSLKYFKTTRCKMLVYLVNQHFSFLCIHWKQTWLFSTIIALYHSPTINQLKRIRPKEGLVKDIE